MALHASRVTEGGIVETTVAGKWQHPPSFYCPISQQCMHDPVILADGHTYERRHIERWLQQHTTSPVSGLQLPQLDMFSNHALRNAIEEYFQQVFSVHRRAIRKTIHRPEAESNGLGTNAPLLRTIDALMQCSMLMSADLNTESVLRQIMEEARTLVGAEAASVFLVDAARENLYSTVNSTGGELRIPINGGIAGHVATTGEPLVIHDAYSDSRFDDTVDKRTGFRSRSILCVPLKVKMAGVIGVVQLINKTSAGVFGSDGRRQERPIGRRRRRSRGRVEPQVDPQPESFTTEDLQFLQVFACQAATAIAGSGWLLADESGQGQKPVAPTPRAALEKSRSGALCDLSKCQRCWPSQQLALEDPGTPKSQRKAARAVADLRTAADVEEEAQERAEAAARAQGLLAQACAGWELDAYALKELSDNRPLSTLCCYLFEHHGLIDHFGLDREVLGRFFAEIERGYSDAVQYHNREHAACVTHVMHALLEHGKLAESVAPVLAGGAGNDNVQMVRMACLLAAAIHDYEHKGLSNDFLVRTMDDRAVRYNDQHVNENHHVAAAFAVLKRPECNFLSHLPAASFRRFRNLVIEVVLGTDMADNAKILQAFDEVLNAASSPTARGDGEATAPESFEPANEKEAKLLLQMAIKCADLGHLALPWEAHVQWVRRLEAEFFAQGDREKDLGLQPISFLMDRNKPGASETQVGFFDFVVLPLFRSFVRARPGAGPLLEGVLANYRCWKEADAARAAATAAALVAAATAAAAGKGEEEAASQAAGPPWRGGGGPSGAASSSSSSAGPAPAAIARSGLRALRGVQATAGRRGRDGESSDWESNEAEFSEDQPVVARRYSTGDVPDGRHEGRYRPRRRRSAHARPDLFQSGSGTAPHHETGKRKDVEA